MNLAFDTPQWSLVPDTFGPRRYANVSNELQVTYGEYELAIPIAVPTNLFSLMRAPLNISRLADVSLYLDFEGGFWLFGIETDNGETLVDLWRYSHKDPPDCVKYELGRRFGVSLR